MVRWKTDSRWAVVIVGAIVIGWPLVHGTVEMEGFLAATPLDIFVLYMTSPLMLVMPLLAAWAGSTRLVAELGHRHLVNVRVRESAVAMLSARLRTSILVPGALFTASVVGVAIVVFALWPTLGAHAIDPSVHDLSTPQKVTQYDATLTGLSQTTVAGPWAFALVYAFWNGFTASVYGAFAVAVMILTGNRVVGLLMPVGVYLVESIVAATAVHTYAGLMYSFAPAALMQAPVVVTLAPTLLLAAAIAVVWVVIFRRSVDLRVLR